MKRHLISGHWSRDGRAVCDSYATMCCNGDCQQGRRCPLVAHCAPLTRTDYPVEQCPLGMTRTDRAIVIAMYVASAIASTAGIAALIVWILTRAER